MGSNKRMPVLPPEISRVLRRAEKAPSAALEAGAQEKIGPVDRESFAENLACLNPRRGSADKSVVGVYRHEY